jgi:hypothetical protein
MRWMALVLLAACSGASSGKKTEDLMSDVRDFQEGLRWRRYEDAALLVPSANREKFLDAHEELDADLRIDDYEIERLSLAKDQLHATVRVRITWHLDSAGKVHDTVIDESWQRDGKTWHIVGSEHKRGEVLPAKAMP